MSLVSVLPPTGNRRGRNGAAAGVDRYVGRSAADVEQDDADVLFLVASNVAADDASGSKTMPAGSSPARCTHLSTLVMKLLPPVTMCVSTSRRPPDMPIGIGDAVVPVDREVARQRVDDLPLGADVDQLRSVDDAPDVARATSRSSPPTATTPRLFVLCTCSPVTPT